MIAEIKEATKVCLKKYSFNRFFRFCLLRLTPNGTQIDGFLLLSYLNVIIAEIQLLQTSQIRNIWWNYYNVNM